MSNRLQISKQQRIGLGLVISVLFIDMLLYSLIIPVIPYFTEKFQPSSTMLGILFSSYAVALLLTTPFFGPLSDRIGRRKPLLFGLAGLAISTLLFAFADTMITLIAARFIQGIAAAATWSAALALLADLFPARSRGTVMGIALTGISTGSLLGAPLGGWLLEAGGYMTPFLFATVLTVINIFMILLLLSEAPRTKQEESGSFAILRNRSVLFVAAVVLIAESAMCLLEPTLPVFFSDHLTASPLMIGLLFGLMTLAYGMMAPISGSLSNRLNPNILMLGGLVCLTVTMPLVVMSQAIWQVAGAMILVGASIGLSLSPTLSSLASIVDNEGSGSYGAAYALFNMFHAVGMIIGPLIGGVLTDVMPIPSAIIAVSIVILVFIGVLGRTLRPKKQQELRL